MNLSKTKVETLGFNFFFQTSLTEPVIFFSLIQQYIDFDHVSIFQTAGVELSIKFSSSR